MTGGSHTPEVPPAEGFGKGRADYKEHVEHRRFLGYGIGLTAIAGILGLAVYSFRKLHELQAPKTALEEHFLIVQLLAHAVVAVALVFFSYQLLRAAERLILPYWWIAENPETAKVLLGISDPATVTAKAMNQAAEMANKLK